MSLWIIAVALLALLALWAVGIYNRLVQLQNQVKNGWSQIDIQLQRRYDLIPNLVESVKGIMNFEKSTLEAVVNARSKAVLARERVQNEGGPTGDASLKDLLQAEVGVKSALGNFFALSENYPDLKSSANMKGLQEELASTENRIAFARQSYNDAAMSYNTYQQEFPNLLLASPFRHHPVEMYTTENEEAKKAVKVSF